MNFKNVLFRFLRYIRPYWPQLTIILSFMVLSSVSSLAFPYIMKIIIDDVIPGKDFELLVKILVILFGINFIGIIISFISSYLYTWVSNKIMLDMRRDLFNHLVRLPLDFFNKNKTGDLVHRINNEVNVIQSAITASVLRFVISTLTIIGLVAMLCWLNYKLFLFSIVVLPFLFFNVKYFQPKIRHITELARKKNADILSFFVERFENIKLIQSYNRHEYEDKKLTININELIGFNLKNVIYSTTTGSISGFLMSLTPIIIFGWGGGQVMSGVMTLGALVAFLQYLSRLFDPFKNLMSLYIDLLRASVSMKRVFEFFDVPAQVIDRSKIKNFPFKRSIRFTNISFGYNGKQVLNNFNLEILKGKKYALVGASGCGKSTVINLLCHFYEPDTGIITIDDLDIRSLNLFELRNRIGLVTQDNQLFHDTVWENIRYGNLESDDEQIKIATKQVDLFDHIFSQQDGFHAVIGDKGTKISGGQQQRIAIARAILKNAEVLILDEATSALDSDSEKKIFDNLQNLYQEKTMILISHRLSTIKEVDEIICIENGKIVERGTHEILISQKSYYWRLFKDQIE